MTPSKRDVHFAAKSWVRHLSFGFGVDEGFRFSSESPFIDVSLSPPQKEEEERRGVGSWCEVRRTLSAGQLTAEFISSLCKGFYLATPGAPLSLPHDHGGQRLIENDGRIRSDFFVQRNMLPADVIDLFDSAYNALLDDQSRFIKALRWSRGLGGAPQPHDGPLSVFWRANDSPYLIAPYQPFPAFWRNPVQISWREGSAEEFEKVWQKQEREPTGHELLREAESLLAGAPRSAFLIGVSALETGVKDHLSMVIRGTTALFAEIPSPPIEKLFRLVLPEVHPELDTVAWKKMPLLKSLQDMVTARNSLAHRGINVDREKVADYLDVVHDLLYMLDALRGHEWAKQLLYSQPAKDFLKWAGPALTRVQIRSKDFR